MKKKEVPKKQTLLPKTGEQRSVVSGLIGGLFSLTSLLIVYLRKKLSEKVTNGF